MIESVEARAEKSRDAATALRPPDAKPAPRNYGLSDLVVIDDVLVNPWSYRARALELTYRSIPVGPATFHGIADCTDPSVPDLIRSRYPSAVPGLTFFRQSPLGQEEPNFLHTDRDMGDWTAILYLNPDPPKGDGTTFWTHRDTGATASRSVTQDESLSEWQAWRDREQWDPWHTVAAQFNRLLLFPAPCFHSRALFANYGTGSDARLIQLVFGTGALSCVSQHP